MFTTFKISTGFTICCGPPCMLHGDAMQAMEALLAPAHLPLVVENGARHRFASPATDRHLVQDALDDGHPSVVQVLVWKAALGQEIGRILFTEYFLKL